MASYIVCGIDLDLDGKRLKDGDVIELDPKEAKRLERWIKPEKPAPAPEKKETKK